MAYARPVLCRLCCFPAPDGGVPVSQVDRGKLSEWCLRMMDTDLDQEGLDEAVFCQFCVWQARFFEEYHDPSETSRLQIWWRQRDWRTDYGYKYFLDGIVQPCAVSIPVMSKELLQKHNLLAGSGTLQIQKRKGVLSNCTYCSAQLESKAALVRHVDEEHHTDVTFRCFVCNHFFLSSQEKKSHHNKFHLRLKVKCPLCLEQLASKYNLAKHMRIKHNTETFYCTYHCGASFANDKLRRQHVQEMHEVGGKVNCIYCDKYFWPSELTSHVKSCHESIYIKCEVVAKCTSFFLTKEERNRHALEVHLSRFNRVKCIYCQKWRLRKQLSKHVKEKHKLVRIKCHYHNCATYFHTHQEKQKHILEVHESGEDKYRCIYCKHMVANLGIVQHMRNHHKTEAIKCDYQFKCPNYFLTLEEKQKHILEVHESGQDKIRCKFCPRMVRIKGMIAHISIHHRSESKGKGVEEEMVKCIYCQRQLKKVYLPRHTRKNHKTEAIRCNFHSRCITFFHTLEDRQKHIDQVHLTGKEVPVSTCQLCKSVLSSSSKLRRHIENRHPEAFKCTLSGCWGYFSSIEQRDEHFEKVHVPEEKSKPLKCCHCSFTTTSIEERKTHTAKAHKTATVRCPKCPRMFKSKSALNNHLSNRHGATRNCPHCLGVVKTTWTVHVQRTSCPNCKTAFACRGIRAKHPRKCFALCL